MLRKKQDVLMTKRADLTREDLDHWIEELFGTWFKEDCLEKSDLDKFAKVVKESYCRLKKKGKHLVLRKVLHTKEVVEAGEEIAEGEKDKGSRRMVLLVCLVHDLGRFPQILAGFCSDRKTGIDHAAVGAEIVEENWRGSLTGSQLKSLREAVFEHNKHHYKGDNFYAKLVRDADKLALMRFADELLREYKIPQGRVSEGAVCAVEGREVVGKKDLCFAGDYYLTYLSWIWDFGLATSKTLYLKEGLKDKFLAGLKRESREAWERVKDLV